MFIAESIGRAYRDHKGALETEPGTPPPSVDASVWQLFSSSKLGVQELGALDDALAAMTEILSAYK